MLFNTYQFIFVFLPITFFVYFYLGNKNLGKMAIAWLVLCSLFFYGWWNPAYLLLIIFSMLFNFAFGTTLSSKEGVGLRKWLLTFGVIVNVGLLAYFKYANFVVSQVEWALDTQFNIEYIVLPLAISFFTFQQIAFLVDSYRKETSEYSFLHYCLFVTFFPQLIAGPIVHHKDMLPQFLQEQKLKAKLDNIAIGLSIFAIGFFKKTVLADGIAPYANVVFADAANGEEITMLVAWGGALAYTFQLYFDFSGYSDMAIGLARLFGIILPLNFYSPYKAMSISEFWRRWHITLSNFLRDYVYIALGGNKFGEFNRYKNLFLTMFIGGLWHGAGWNFMIWGILHGSYLIINHLWRTLDHSWSTAIPVRIKHFSAWTLTFLAVVIGWVFFRATTFDSAISLLKSMVGLNGVSIPNAVMSQLGGLQTWLMDLGVEAHLGGGGQFVSNWLWISVLMVIALVMPNTQDMFFKHNGSLTKREHDPQTAVWPLFRWTGKLHWQASRNWACLVALAFIAGVMTFSQVSEFLYFQF